MLSRAHCCPVSNSKINEWLATYAIEGSADISSDARIPLRRAIFHDRLDKIRYDTICKRGGPTFGGVHCLPEYRSQHCKQEEVRDD